MAGVGGTSRRRTKTPTAQPASGGSLAPTALSTSIDMQARSVSSSSPGDDSPFMCFARNGGRCSLAYPSAAAWPWPASTCTNMRLWSENSNGEGEPSCESWGRCSRAHASAGWRLCARIWWAGGRKAGSSSFKTIGYRYASNQSTSGLLLRVLVVARAVRRGRGSGEQQPRRQQRAATAALVDVAQCCTIAQYRESSTDPTLY